MPNGKYDINCFHYSKVYHPPMLCLMNPHKPKYISIPWRRSENNQRAILPSCSFLPRLCTRRRRDAHTARHSTPYRQGSDSRVSWSDRDSLLERGGSCTWLDTCSPPSRRSFRRSTARLQRSKYVIAVRRTEAMTLQWFNHPRICVYGNGVLMKYVKQYREHGQFTIVEGGLVPHYGKCDRLGMT